MSTQESSSQVLLKVDHLVKEFRLEKRRLWSPDSLRVHAVSDVSFEVRRGETVGLVGETGCGKSTLARCVIRLLDLTSGKITFDGRDISTLRRGELRPLRREMQMIFQDPYGSLNPHRTVGSIIGDPYAIHAISDGQDRRRRVQELMEVVGLNPIDYNRFPAEFSGGQRQRVGVARAVALRPKLIVCDEPVSALDLSTQAQVLNLLMDLQREFKLTYLFIAHDLSVVQRVSDRIAVMYLGQFAEVAPRDRLYSTPRHPYSSALLSAVPIPDPDASDRRTQVLLAGDQPSPANPPSGCRFHNRCPRAQERCKAEVPRLRPAWEDPPTHLVACHYPLRDGEQLVDRPGRPTGATDRGAAT